MNITDKFKLKDTISFNTRAPAILGTRFDRVKVLGVLDSQSAAQLGVDVVGMHRNIFPLLPQGTPDDIDAQPYLKIQLPSGTITAISMAWMNLDTVTVFESTSAQFTVSDIGPADIERIVNILKANGYNSVESRVL